MTWTRISDTFLDDPDLLTLSRSARLLLVEGRVWSNRHGTDGRIPKRIVPRISDAEPGAVTELAAAGLWVDEDAAWTDPHFLDDQLSAAEIAQRREATAARQRRWRERQSATTEEPPSRVTSRVTDDVSNAVSNAAPSLPIPSLPIPLEDTPSRADARGVIDAAWETFWELYPRKVGKQDARKAFVKAARTVDAEVIVGGAARLAEDPNLPDKEFIPHPATWLRQGRWEDEPLPARHGGSRADDVFRRELARIDAQEPGRVVPLRQIGG